MMEIQDVTDEWFRKELVSFLQKTPVNQPDPAMLYFLQRIASLQKQIDHTPGSTLLPRGCHETSKI